MKKNNKVKTSSWFSKKLVPKLMGLPETTHLAAIRDGLGLLMPLTIVGSIGTLGVTFLFGGWGTVSTSVLGWIANIFDGVIIKDATWTFIEGSAWQTISDIGTSLMGPLKAYTLDSFSIYSAFLLSYLVGQIRGIKEPAYAAIVGLASFLIVTRAEKFYFDGTGMFLSMVISLIAGEMYCWIIKSGKFQIKVEGGAIPPAISKGFINMIPMLLVLMSVSTLDAASWALGKYANISVMSSEAIPGEDGGIVVGQIVKFAAGSFGFGGLFIQFISGPMLNIVGTGNASLGVAIFYLFGIGIFWSFGIHGSNMMNIAFWPVFLALLQVNLNLKTMGVPIDSDQYNIFTAATFDGMIIISGGGITGALVLGILIFGSDFLQEKKIAKLALPPQVFNINEPVTFGFPIMLNARWILPFILTMPTAAILTFLAYKMHIINPTYILIPWTLPFGLAGLMATGMDPMGLVMWWVNFAAAFCIYLPFVFLSNILIIRKLKKAGIYEEEKLRVANEKKERLKAKFDKKMLRIQQNADN